MLLVDHGKDCWFKGSNTVHCKDAGVSLNALVKCLSGYSQDLTQWLCRSGKACFERAPARETVVIRAAASHDTPPHSIPITLPVMLCERIIIGKLCKSCSGLTFKELTSPSLGLRNIPWHKLVQLFQ